jgi:DNA-binding NarL/FixJ family response regulator
VSVASNGEKAVSLCRRKAVDLVITDLMMPEREGIETIRYFMKEIPHIKIIAMSGAMDPLFLRAAEMLGAQSVLQKPFKIGELVEAVRAVIG